ncbi:MAG: precorrin-6y C5,15-methyltransferase (decarboxylating) subunit CbiE, partial [Pikeienuella sp.]
MNAPWLDVIGIGEAGLDGLLPEARALLLAAEVVIGGDRFPQLAGAEQARRIPWPSPYQAMIRAIRAERGRRLAVLVTGDPLWYSVGARLLRAIPGEEIRFHPQLSAFQFAAARMRWSLADAETLTLHRRPAETAIRYFAPGARLLMLAEGAATPPAVARLLVEHGYGPSAMTVLGALGGPRESRIDGMAESWSAPCPDFLTLAVECRPAQGAKLESAALSDRALAPLAPPPFAVRAAVLAALWPRRGARLLARGPGAGA